MSSVITQEIHILRTIFGENIIDSVINTIETEIKNAPDKIDETSSISNALRMFTDLVYSDNGTKRLLSMEQFGSIYVCKVFDYTSSKPFVYLAYSLYDIIETFNKSDNKLKVPYVRIHESLTDNQYSVMIVDYPQNYNSENCYDPEDEKALNEIGKYKICFTNGPCVDLICNPHIISVSNPYVSVTPINISKSMCGNYKFVFDEDHSINVQYSLTLKDEDVTELSIFDLFDTIDKEYLSERLADKDLVGIKIHGLDSVFTIEETKSLCVENGFKIIDVVMSEHEEASIDEESKGVENDEEQ